MASVVAGEPPVKTDDNPQANKNDTVENFQKFIYELFEKNGVLNDLRAYLRGHIIDVIKNAQTGDPPACQKHFTQRLELTYQALNMLVVEYLLSLEFSYSLSVFVSEIPLANMVFGFAQTLLQTGNSGHLKLRFSDSDIWSVLNYLGMKCDSVHASNVVDTYRNDEQLPLLLCILKCMPLYHKETVSAEGVPKSGNTSSESLPSTPNSSDTVDKSRCAKTNGCSQDKCKHYVFCKTCQDTMRKVKDKYKRKKETLSKNIKDTAMNPVIGEILLKNISTMEKALIDEMFQQLKTVYEAEIEMVKKEEEKKIKRSLASHTMLLQKHQDELDEAFKIREEELARSVQQKKKFLWGLAKALREQHAQMSRAMDAVKNETERLSAKENSLKTQLIEAESILRTRGEEMRSQISNELTILEHHLESMKRERDTIQKERRELENYKSEYDSKLSINNDIQSHYNLVKNELGILKKYLESTKIESKCVIERSTLTEMCDVTSKINIILNNEQDSDRNLLKSESDDRVSRAPNQMVNNLKKQNNINFSNPHLDIIYQDRVSSHDRSRSITGEVGDITDPRRDGQQIDRTVYRLQEENERLKTFARQQRQHIDDLNQQQARLQAQLTAASFQVDCTHIRPRTAPSVLPQTNFLAERFGTTVNCFGWRKGAGEEMSTFSNAQPRIVVPGDALPFVGVLHDRQTDYRRHMISQWRSLRRRVSPLAGARARPLRASARQAHDERPPHDDTHAVPTGSTLSAPDPKAIEVESIRETSDTCINQLQCSLNENTQPPHTAISMEVKATRDKSPKSVLREAKQKLRNKNTVVRNLPQTTNREKSPNSVLREAKLRLRKLEIEAEAVEKSYLDFKMRHTERRKGQNCTHHLDNIDLNIGKLDMKRNRFQKLDENRRFEANVHTNYLSIDERQYIKNDFNKYIKKYQTNFNITDTPASKSGVEKTRPIPETFSEIDNHDKDIKVKNNYLETPLMEFRKLYHSQKTSIPFRKIERISYPDTGTAEPSRNSENAENEQSLLRNIYPEKVEPPRTSESNTINDQELSRTVYQHAESGENGENNTQNIQNLPVIVYPEVEPERNSENTSNEIKIADRQFKPVIESDSGTRIMNTHAELEILKDNLLKIYNVQGQIKPVMESDGNTQIRNKQAELEILKDNLSKIYNLQGQIKPVMESDSDAKITNRQAELEILKDNLSKIYNLQGQPIISKTGRKPTMEHTGSVADNDIIERSEENNLRIEVESVSKSNNLKISESQAQELVLVVQSSIETRVTSISDKEEKEKISTGMIFLVSPKSLSPRGGNAQSPQKSLSPYSIERAPGSQPSKLTQDEFLDNNIENDPNNELILSNDMRLNLSKEGIEEDSISDYDKGDDDFSADVDNYNSRSDYENNSPISLPKTYEDDNFWDS